MQKRHKLSAWHSKIPGGDCLTHRVPIRDSNETPQSQRSILRCNCHDTRVSLLSHHCVRCWVAVSCWVQEVAVQKDQKKQTESHLDNWQVKPLVMGKNNLDLTERQSMDEWLVGVVQLTLILMRVLPASDKRHTTNETCQIKCHSGDCYLVLRFVNLLSTI